MSIVAMKRKMEAKKNLSKNGNFSLNGKRCNSNVVAASVKNARYARSNLHKTKVCFNGEDGVQCERVWDGKRMPGVWEDYGGGTAMGESLTQEEYIEKKRLKSTECLNLLFTYNNFEAGVTVISIFKDLDTFSFNFGGKKYTPVWNHSYNVIASNVQAAAEKKAGDDLAIAINKKEGAEAAEAVAGAGANTLTNNELIGLVDATTNTKTGTDAIYFQQGIDAIKNAITPSDIASSAAGPTGGKAQAAAALVVIQAEHTDAVAYAGNPNIDTCEGKLKSIGVKGLRTTVVTVSTALGDIDMSFKNPEISIFEPVGCIEGLTQSGDGGTSINDIGYYGRGTCKVHYVRKDRSMEIKYYDGLGGYMDRLKQPNLDPSFCGV